MAVYIHLPPSATSAVSSAFTSHLNTYFSYFYLVPGWETSMLITHLLIIYSVIWLTFTLTCFNKVILFTVSVF